LLSSTDAWCPKRIEAVASPLRGRIDLSADSFAGFRRATGIPFRINVTPGTHDVQEIVESPFSAKFGPYRGPLPQGRLQPEIGMLSVIPVLSNH
jgi:hypothetical protein